MAAEALEAAVRPGDHHDRVPTDERADAALEVLVAWEPRLLLGWDRVDVRRRDRRGDADALLPRPFHEPGQEVARAGLPADVDDRVERVEPLARLRRIDVRDLMHEPVDEHEGVPPNAVSCPQVTPLPFGKNPGRLSTVRCL